MKERKIALFSRSVVNGGGVERVVINLAIGIASRGHSVDLLLLSAEGSYLELLPNNINVVNFNKSGTLATLPGLVRYIRQNKPSIIYCAETERGMVGLMAKFISFTDTKIVIGIHITIAQISWQQLTNKGKLLRWMVRLFFPFAHKIIPVSSGVAEEQVEIFKIPKHKIQVIYNPVVTKKLKEDMNQPIDHDWFVGKKKPVILAAGRLEGQKDFSTLLHAFKNVLDHIDANLVIIGEGSQRQMLESLVDELELTNYVDLPGFVNNPYAYMKNADLFVLSSVQEGLPTVLIEALACGCPIVSTDCPSGPSEILDKGEYGILVPVGDPTALAGKIVQTLEQEYDAEKLMHRADDFSEDMAINAYLELFQSL